MLPLLLFSLLVSILLLWGGLLLLGGRSLKDGAGEFFCGRLAWDPGRAACGTVGSGVCVRLSPECHPEAAGAS